MPPSAQLKKSCINPRREKGQYREREGGVSGERESCKLQQINWRISRRLNE